VQPDALTTTEGSTYARSDDPHAKNRAALTPCPVCNANAHEGPEGERWVQFPHCWQCGYKTDRPNNTSVNTPVVPSLAPAQVEALAAAVVARMLDQGWSPPAAAAIPATATPVAVETGGEPA
jgi:hypothetical protein